MDKIKIGDWSFEPDTGVIEHGDVVCRLEHRASALLELLAQHPGQVVSQPMIIDHVWDGRTVSPNSIAVVISDLRRALNDDPKAPKVLETLPKRGYRLIADVARPRDRVVTAAIDKKPALRLGLSGISAVGIAIVAVLFWVLSFGQSDGALSDRIAVSVSATTNETGDERYLPLTRSVTELLAVNLSQYDQFEVSSNGGADLEIRSKLILWDGHPSMSIYAESPETGEIVWSGMASGPETLLPRQVRGEIAELAAATASSDLHE